jgi:hypothetical protein
LRGLLDPLIYIQIFFLKFQVIQILTPIFFGNLANVDKPLDLFMRIYPMRMAVTFLLATWVFITPWFRGANNEYPWEYFFAYTVLNGVYSLIFSALALAKTLFFTQVSDKKIGGTYMTLLNTVSNIGVAWPATLALYLMDVLSLKSCEDSVNSGLRNMSVVDRGRYMEVMSEIKGNVCRGESEVKVGYFVLKTGFWWIFFKGLITNRIKIEASFQININKFQSPAFDGI